VGRAARGEAAAREELLDLFMPLIANLARLYRRSSSVDREDLMQEGVVGFLRALERFDPSIGTPFWPYAWWWVRQAMQKIVASMSRPVVLSDRALRTLARLKDARSRHTQLHGHEPSTPDLVRATGFALDQVQRLLAVDQVPRGLEEPVGGGAGAATFEDLLPDPTAGDAFDRVLERVETHELRHLAELDPRELDIVRSRYGLDRPSRTLREVAEQLGLSAERVRQIEARALGKLRDAVAASQERRALTPVTPLKAAGAGVPT
jgi:RNA polymerase sigma factor (sigma-70 family)